MLKKSNEIEDKNIEMEEMLNRVKVITETLDLDNAEFIDEICKLKTVQKRYCSLFDNIKCCAAVYEAVNNGENFIIKDFNKSAEIQEKVLKEDIIGCPVTEVFPGVIEFGLFEVFREVYLTGIPQHFPIAFYNDKRISGWRSNNVFKLESGEIVVTYLDQSELKVLEKDFLETKKYLELAIEGTGAGIWEWDISNDTLKCNEKWWDILGYTGEKYGIVPREVWKELYHPVDYKKMNTLIKEYLTGNIDVYQCEVRLRHKLGYWIWVLNSGSLVEKYNNNEAFLMAGTHIDITELKKTQFERDKYYNELKNILKETVNAVSTAIELRDPYTAGHQRNVAELSKAVALELGLEDIEVNRIVTAAKLHDIGKIYIDDEILNKKGKLTDKEFSIIKTHVEKGYNVLKSMTIEKHILDIVHQHHERLDGSGYPLGLKRDNISLGASIVAVADVFDAMTSDRPYRKALHIDIALSELVSKSDILYNKDVVDVFVDMVRKGKITASGKPN